MAKQKRLYANVQLTNGKEIIGEIDSVYSLKQAIDMISVCKPETVLFIGDYIAVRAGDFSNAYVTYQDPEEVEA